MDPVRPSLSQPAQASNTGSDSARLAAQKAFFDIAMGKARAPAPAAAAAPAAMAAAPVQKLPQPGAEPPARLLRPGSLLDIRV